MATRFRALGEWCLLLNALCVVRSPSLKCFEGDHRPLRLCTGTLFVLKKKKKKKKYSLLPCETTRCELEPPGPGQNLSANIRINIGMIDIDLELYRDISFFFPLLKPKLISQMFTDILKEAFLPRDEFCLSFPGLELHLSSPYVSDGEMPTLWRVNTSSFTSLPNSYHVKDLYG